MSMLRLGPDHPSIAISYNNIGSAFDSKGMYREALENYNKSVKILMKKVPKRHPDLAAVYKNLGFIYQKLNNFPEAIMYYSQALDIQVRVYGATHSVTVQTKQSLKSLESQSFRNWRNDE
jgi:tetratricopeptide (TPR) repeat protein